MSTSMPPQKIQEAAQILWDATQKATPIERLTARYPELALDDAYAVQEAGRRIRESGGARQVGWKMGLTSIAKRQQMSLDSAIFGYLHDAGHVRGSKLALRGLIHPKVEPEIGFRMKRGLKGKVTFGEALEAIGGVCAAAEIIDSRYQGFKYFSLPDVVADNCSAGLFVWGEETDDFTSFALDRLNMRMLVDGKVVQEALAAEISGHPVNSLMQLSEMLGECGHEISAGQIVLAGAATPAVALEPGQKIELVVDKLPRLAFDIA